MIRGARNTVWVLGLALLAGGAAGQDAPVKTILDYYNAYVAAYEAGDYVAYRENLRGALELRPEHPRLMYNLAGANALLGDPDVAFQILERLARGGLMLPAATDSDLVTLWDTPRFLSLAQRFERNEAPQGFCEAVLTLPRRGLIVESVALNPATGTSYLSSVRQRKIMVAHGDAVEDFSSPGDSLWGVFGLKLDPARGLLWACTGGIPQMEGFAPEDHGKTALVGYDLSTRAVRYRFPVPEDGEPHLLGDVVVAADGALYASDSYAPRVYRVPPDLSTIEPWVDLEGFVSPQGITMNSEGVLFVADYLNGIRAVDTDTREQTLLSHPDTVVVFGIDGMYAVEDGLVAVQNGVRPQRVVRLHLNDLAITGMEVLASGQPQFDEPTLGQVVDGDFYFVGSSQWGAYDGDGNPVPDLELSPHIVFRTPLD